MKRLSNLANFSIKYQIVLANINKMQKIYFLMTCLFVLQFAATAQSLTASDAESNVSFVIKNIGINVNGTLSGLKGKMYFDPKNLNSSSFDMTVDVNTINTNNTKRDNHLKTDDFFDAAKFPVIHIKTTKIVSKGGNNYAASAILTIKNVSKNISFAFVAKPSAAGYTFTGGFTINRRDFGVGGSSMIMSDHVKVDLMVVAKR